MMNTEGFQNTAFGNYALNSNTTGNRNIAIGGEALYNNVTGGGNVAIGYQAGYSETGSRTSYTFQMAQLQTLSMVISIQVIYLLVKLLEQ